MKPRVLFICNENACRSQMAEAFLRHYAGDRFEVFSGGTQPSELNADAVSVMAEVGIEMSGQRAKALAPFLGEYFQYVVTVCDRAAERCPVFPGALKRLEWNFEDPARAKDFYMERVQVFRRVRDEIAAKIKQFIDSV